MCVCKSPSRTQESHVTQARTHATHAARFFCADPLACVVTAPCAFKVQKNQWSLIPTVVRGTAWDDVTNTTKFRPLFLHSTHTHTRVKCKRRLHHSQQPPPLTRSLPSQNSAAMSVRLCHVCGVTRDSMARRERGWQAQCIGVPSRPPPAALALNGARAERFKFTSGR